MRHFPNTMDPPAARAAAGSRAPLRGPSALARAPTGRRATVHRIMAHDAPRRRKTAHDGAGLAHWPDKSESPPLGSAWQSQTDASRRTRTSAAASAVCTDRPGSRLTASRRHLQGGPNVGNDGESIQAANRRRDRDRVPLPGISRLRRTSGLFRGCPCWLSLLTLVVRSPLSF